MSSFSKNAKCWFIFRSKKGPFLFTFLNFPFSSDGDSHFLIKLSSLRNDHLVWYLPIGNATSSEKILHSYVQSCTGTAKVRDKTGTV
mmetsp:Transcript_21717/g.35918  ORF Transcript_21717/g.35918 Transcript_21717/m.35918 type:complete len:87 (+) Transcript_21717:478-738(+)